MIDYSLYVITDRRLQGTRTIEEVVKEIIDGGATVVQLREKHLPIRQLLESALIARTITKIRGIPLIINDRVDIAMAVGADGIWR